MKKFNKKKFLVLFFSILIVGVVICFNDVVLASGVKVTYDADNTYVCYDRSNGIYKGLSKGSKAGCEDKWYGYSIVKLINNDYAYCVNWQLKYYGSDNNYVKDTSWKISSANAIKAGYLINLIQNVNGKNYSDMEAYEVAGASLNTLFSKYVNDSGSYNFYDKNNEVSDYLNKADEYYKSVKTTKKLPDISIKTNDNVLSYNDTSKKYFSNKITVSGLVSNYGGSSDKVVYTIEAVTDSGVSANICEKSNGTSCQTKKTLSEISGDYSFYLYVDKDKTNAGDSITIKISGSNNSNYYSSVLYQDSNHGDAQRLVVGSEFGVSRLVNEDATLTVPDLENHKIYIYKVDENGKALSGSNLELRMDSVDGSVLKTNNGSKSMVYSTGNVASNDDDFFLHDYYLVETNSPDGFVFTSSTTPFYLKGTLSGNSANRTLCYKNDSTDPVDNEYCNYSNYTYMCKTDTGLFMDLNENGNCEFEEEIKVEQDENKGDIKVDENASLDGDDGVVVPDDNTGVDDEDTTTEIVTYDKVCFNKTAEIEVIDEYCNSAELYTKVQYSNGNIVVYQTNSRNVINISKTDITGDKEIAGASLKICTKASYDADKDNCSPAKTIDGVEMSWVSVEIAHSIYGVPKGDYYIVETIPPRGYIIKTKATAFSIDGSGKVVVGDKKVTNEEFRNGSAIIIKNNITKITVSKQDVATSLELPGATISICRTYKDKDGNYQMLVDQYTGDCIAATLADGTVATWVSTNKPKVIEGLQIGTYYLVERIAPADYSLAESILFTLKSNGNLVDVNGEKLTDNKLVMYDKIIEKVPTGSLTTYIVVGVLSLATLTGIGCYMYLKKGNKIIKM